MRGMNHTIDQSKKILAQNLKVWGHELGLGAVGIARIHLPEAEEGLRAWLARGFHGSMDYMAKHGTKRTRPAELVSGTVSVISARLNYWPQANHAQTNLKSPERAYISRYALGRDYHKVLRNRLQILATRLQAHTEHTYRVFVDSAPVMEAALARRAGLGWRGKHTLLIDKENGSLFFLGEIYTTLDLPADEPTSAHCGSCEACIKVCPTQAIVAPYQLDARRCISYLTIEHPGPIPIELRPALGNRIYGCDDCQLVCPWNRFAKITQESDFMPRHGLDCATLLELWAWSEAEFLSRFEGSPVRRIGFERWQRNLAVSLGNIPTSTPAVHAALSARYDAASELVREHITWALSQHSP